MGWYIWPGHSEVPGSGLCLLCGKMLKQGDKFYFKPLGAVHAVCELERAEAESRANNRGEAQP